MKGYWAVPVLALGVLACSVGSSAPSGDGPSLSAPTQAVAPVAVVPTPVYVPPECEGRPLPTIESTLVAPSTQAAGANPPLTTEAQLDVLFGLENAVLDNYVYRDFNGLDWPVAVAEIRARVESGMDSGAFYSELQSLINRLGDEHSYFQSPAEVNSERLGQLNFVGIGALLQARLEKGIITVLDVFPESPADHAGLRPHDIILTIDGKPGVENGGRRGTLGPACTQVVLTIQTPGQSLRQGNVEQLHAFDFSDGSRAWLAAARFTPLISGADWEVAGVQPDMVVEGAWEDFTSENDAGVAAAIQLLRGD